MRDHTPNKIRKMLRAQDKVLKIEFKNKYCIENISFEVFKVMNAQFPRLSFYIYFLILCP
jgi:hypothetical protein